MTVSVVIPTYNRRCQVFRAIESVLAQTTPANEIIVVDDGSTDGTAEAIEHSFPSQVRLFRQANAGVSAARNHGIREARGEWIGLLDSDDWWHPEKLKRQFAAIDFYGGKPSVCFTDNVFGGNPEITLSRFEEVGLREAPAIGVIDDMLSYILAEREPFFTSSMLIRRAVLDDIGGFDETLTIREDTDMAFRLCFKTQFCFVGECLTEIDRTPSRTLGLCNLYQTRGDVVFRCSERIYRKWLGMREVIGSSYEPHLRGLLQETYYAWAEQEIHELHLKRARRHLVQVRVLGHGLSEILATLVVRKTKKTIRNWASKINGLRNRRGRPGVGVISTIPLRVRPAEPKRENREYDLFPD